VHFGHTRVERPCERYTSCVRRYLLSIAVLTLVALGASSVAAQADWTTYHGDAALSGVDQSSGTGLPVSLAWTVPGLAGTMWSEPLVFDGLVIVATETNDLYAFNEATGATPRPARSMP
jgi:hypothetical protein